MSKIAAALIRKNGKYLIAKYKKGDRHEGLWGLPQIIVDDGEDASTVLQQMMSVNSVITARIGQKLATAKVENNLTAELYECFATFGEYHSEDYEEVVWANSLDELQMGSFELTQVDDNLLLDAFLSIPKASIHNLKKGKSYSNQEIVNIFKCYNQGGMRRSDRTNTLVLIAIHDNTNPYIDEWRDGIMHYTGMGLDGDQSIDYSQNRTLAESQINGLELHLFERYVSLKYEYKGMVELADKPYYEKQTVNGQSRKVVKYPLRVLE